MSITETVPSGPKQQSEGTSGTAWTEMRPLLSHASMDQIRGEVHVEFLDGARTTVEALKSSEATTAALDAEWGSGTRSGMLRELNNEEALALRLFMGGRDIDSAATAAHMLLNTEPLQPKG